MGKLYVNRILNDAYYNRNSNLQYASINELYNYCHNQSKIKKEDFTKKKIREWLSAQNAYTLHYPSIRNFKRNHYRIFMIDELWEIDLIDFRAINKYNNGFNWILICIDVFSKYIWAVPMKRKTGYEVTKAMKKIFEESNRKCEKVCSDKGKEFDNITFKTFLKHKNVVQQFANNPVIKCSIVERVIKTIKSKIFKYFTYSNSQNYIDNLQNIINTYNNCTHSTIKKKPNEVSVNNSLEIYSVLKKKYEKDEKRFPSLLVNDCVKIHASKYNVFAKGYKQKWSSENFKIKEVLLKNPYPVYILTDLNGIIIKGRFYVQELQKVL